MSTFRRCATGLIFLLNILPFIANAQGEGGLQVASAAWKPYTGNDLPSLGLANDLVHTALRRAGYTPYVTIEPWQRVLEGAKLGVYDVITTPWYSDERNEFLDYSEPYLQNRIVFVQKQGSKFDYQEFSDLKSMLIGVVTDYAYDERFNQSRTLTKISERHLIQNLLKLVQGRIDLTLDDELVLKYEINQFMPNRMKELEFLPKPLAVQGLHIGVSRENPDHAKIVAGFNKAIAEMKQDGTFQKILDKHKAYIENPVQ